VSALVDIADVTVVAVGVGRRVTVDVADDVLVFPSTVYFADAAIVRGLAEARY
jgi:hypothetical protein